MESGRDQSDRVYEPAGGSRPDLAWVDPFFRAVRRYIAVRPEDNLLIKRPNQAVKLNPTGVKLLAELLAGTPVTTLLEKVGGGDQRQREIARFLHAVRDHVDGTLSAFPKSPAVDTQPFDMRFSDYPVLSEVALTYRCNLACQFCYAGCNRTANPVGSDQEMTPRQIKAVLRKLVYEAKVPSVSFTGGEPTLVPRLTDYIRFAKRLEMRVNLITNGVLIDESRARTLADAGLDSAQVSLEGVRAEVHDAVVGCPGAFEKTVAAVRHLRTAGIHTHTNTTITRQNLRDCTDMPAFVAEQLGNPRFSMNLIIPTGSGATRHSNVVRYEEVGDLLEEVIARSRRYGVEFMWYSPVPMCLFNSITHGLGNKGCSACDGLISVAPNGDVLPCASYDHPVGNLLRQPFDEIWQGGAARRYRDKALAHPRCRECDHFHLCNGACPLYFRQMGFAELERANDWG